MRALKVWFNRNLLELMNHNVLVTKMLLSEMLIVPKTTYRYAVLEVCIRWYQLKTEIYKTLFVKEV